MPLLLPAHVHVQGPVPETDDAVPVVHKLVVGALVRLAPLDEPHTPFTTATAEHWALVPLLLPAHVQIQGPVPTTEDAAPEVHKLVVGALVRLAPLDEPHAPFTATTAAEH